MESLTKQSNKNTLDVSIIIHIYNNEKYLHQCLDSIIKQTLENIEIICIDDCSNDSSYKILRYYESIDNRIIILQNNQKYGASVSYNKCLDIAKGKYICFIDADDWICENNLEYAFNIAQKNKLDLILYKSELFNKKSQKFKKTCDNSLSVLKEFENKIFNYNDINPQILYLISCSVKSKLYSRDLIESNNIRFTEKVASDNMLFFNECFLKSDRITVLDKYFYILRNPESNINPNKKESRSEIIIFDELLNILLKDYDFYEKFHEQLYNYIFTNFEEHLKNLAIDDVIDYFYEFKELITKFIVEYDLYDDIENSLEYTHLETYNLVVKSIDSNKKDIYTAQNITNINSTVSIIIDNSKKSPVEIKDIFKSIFNQDIGFQFLEIYIIDNNLNVKTIIKEFSETFYNVHIINKNEIKEKSTFLEFIKKIPTDYIIFINEIIEKSFIRNLYDRKSVNLMISCLPSKEIYIDTGKNYQKSKDSLLSLENKLLNRSLIENEEYISLDKDGNITLDTNFYINNNFSHENIIDFLNYQLECCYIDDYNIIIEILKNNFYNKKPADKLQVFKDIKRFFNKLIQFEQYDKIISNLNKSNKEFFDIVLMSLEDDNSNIKDIQNKIKVDIPVSIIVYIKDNPVNEVNNLIHSIIRQNFGFPHLEILLLNNNSKDPNTLIKLEEFNKTCYNIKLVNIEEEISSAYAYNLGVDFSDKQYFMFTNKKHILLNNATKNMFKAIRNGNMNLATGYVQEDKTEIPENNIYTKIIKNEFIYENNIKFYCEEDTVVIDKEIIDLKGIVKVDIPVIKR